MAKLLLPVHFTQFDLESVEASCQGPGVSSAADKHFPPTGSRAVFSKSVAILLPPTAYSVSRIRGAYRSMFVLRREHGIPALDRWDVSVVAQDAQRRRIEKKMTSGRRGKSEPPGRKSSEKMPVGEKGDISRH
jgi:hypothetical protein